MRRPTRLPRRYVRDERGRYALRPEWVRTELVIDVGLIVLGVYILQAFISTGVSDIAGKISVVAWAVAIPQLAFLAVLSQVLSAYRYYSYPWYLSLARSLGQGAAVLGFGAALWRLWMPASLVLLASGLIAMVVYGFSYSRLEEDNRAAKS